MLKQIEATCALPTLLDREFDVRLVQNGHARYPAPKMNGKQRAAREALRYLHDGMVLGLGTGSTSEYFIRALGEAVRLKTIVNLRCVATSLQSENLARELGLTVITLAECGVVDLSVDGADEIDPHLHLIKGLGGALVREKIVEQNSRRFICIADISKLVPKLGTKGPLPVEVLPFAHEVHASFFKTLGATSQLRLNSDGSPFVSDNGNYIYDLSFSEGIAIPAELEQKLRSRAGIVGTGLFVSMADTALIGSDLDEKVRVIKHS